MSRKCRKVVLNDMQYRDCHLTGVPVEEHDTFEYIVHGRVSLLLSVIGEYCRFSDEPKPIKMSFNEARRHPGIIALWNQYMNKHPECQFTDEIPFDYPELKEDVV